MECVGLPGDIGPEHKSKIDKLKKLDLKIVYNYIQDISDTIERSINDLHNRISRKIELEYC